MKIVVIGAGGRLGHEVAEHRRNRDELVLRNLPALRHLRPDLALLVGGEQGVVDHVAVVARDVGRGPDRIEDLQVRVHHDLQRRLRGGRHRHREAEGGGGHQAGQPA